MKISFENVYGEDGAATDLAIAMLYTHLEQRTPEQNISHRTMPTLTQHTAFVNAKPYAYWWLVYDTIEADAVDEAEPLTEHICIGQVYLTRQREIGIFLTDDYQRRGAGTEIVHKVMELAQPRGPFFANVSPKNIPSQKFFEGMGFQVTQLTYRFDPMFFDEPLYPGHPAYESRRDLKIGIAVEREAKEELQAELPLG